jgi:hypothetical protein
MGGGPRPTLWPPRTCGLAWQDSANIEEFLGNRNGPDEPILGATQAEQLLASGTKTARPEVFKLYYPCPLCFHTIAGTACGRLSKPQGIVVRRVRNHLLKRQQSLIDTPQRAAERISSDSGTREFPAAVGPCRCLRQGCNGSELEPSRRTEHRLLQSCTCQNEPKGALEPETDFAVSERKVAWRQRRSGLPV